MPFSLGQAKLKQMQFSLGQAKLKQSKLDEMLSLC